MLLYSMGILGGIAVQTWGIIRYMIGRQDKHAADFQKELNRLRDSAVSKSDYHRDHDRLYNEMKAVRDETGNISRSVSQLVLTMAQDRRRGPDNL